MLSNITERNPESFSKTRPLSKHDFIRTLSDALIGKIRKKLYLILSGDDPQGLAGGLRRSGAVPFVQVEKKPGQGLFRPCPVMTRDGWNGCAPTPRPG